MLEFSVEGFIKSLPCQIIDRRGKIWLLSKALKFGLNFQKFALKLFKN